MRTAIINLDVQLPPGMEGKDMQEKIVQLFAANGIDSTVDLLDVAGDDDTEDDGDT